MAPEPNDVEPNEQNKPIDIEDITSQTVCLSKVMSSSHFASDISRLIASETSEYCYFNTQLLKNKWSLRSMGHWNPFMKKSTYRAILRDSSNFPSKNLTNFFTFYRGNCYHKSTKSKERFNRCRPTRRLQRVRRRRKIMPYHNHYDQPR